MKRFLIISGCFFLLLGIFHESLPVELASGLWDMFSSNPRTSYFRVVPSEQVDYTQIVLLGLGSLLLVAGLLRRPSNKSANQ